MRLDLGCGRNKKEGYLGIDRSPELNPDLLYDILDKLPFDTDSVEAVYSSHFLEHLKNPELIITEVWRICKKGADVFFRFPLNLSVPDKINGEHKTEFKYDFIQKYINPDKFDVMNYQITIVADLLIPDYEQAEINLKVKK